MKKIIMTVLFSLTSIVYANAYFDGGINYINGTDNYQGKNAYALIGLSNKWIKPEYSSYKADGIDNINKYSIRLGLDKSLYTISFLGGLVPEKNNYKNKTFGADITFSLNPTSSNKKRLAGPNYGFSSTSAKGVTQIDLGMGSVYTMHTITNKDINQLDVSFFAGLKILMAQMSANYTAYSYDKSISGFTGPLMQKLSGINSFLPSFPKSNINVRLDLISYPMVTPFISYNKVKFKDSTIDNLNAYNFGAYVDLNMINIIASYETYKYSNKRDNFISTSIGIRF